MFPADKASGTQEKPGPLAQLAEQRTFNPRVAGSSPARPTNSPLCFRSNPKYPAKTPPLSDGLSSYSVVGYSARGLSRQTTEKPRAAEETGRGDEVRTEAAVRAFLANRCALELSPKTINWYRQHLERFARQYPGLPTDPEDIEAFLTDIQGTPATKHAYFRTLKAFYHFLSKRYHLKNPIAHMSAPHVQSNIYHGLKGIIHTVVLAFESVIVRGAPKPYAAERAVREVLWVDRGELSTYSLLPGTQQFVKCLEELDRASYSARNIYIRLERRGPTGEATHYWELHSVYDLIERENFNVVERSGNLVTRTIQCKIRSNVRQADLFKTLTERVRSLAAHGYFIVHSSHPRFAAGANLI